MVLPAELLHRRSLSVFFRVPRFLNIKLDDIAVQQPERYPHLVRKVPHE